MPSSDEMVRDGSDVLLGVLQHRSRQGDADAARQRFRQLMGDAPSFSMELPSWHCQLVARDAEIRLDSDHRLAVVLHGQLYGLPTDDAAGYVLEAYRSRGRGFASELNGSFRLFLFDARQDRALVVTDRVASRKVFAGGDETERWFVTSPSLIPAMDSRPLDLAGVADYVTSGVIHNGRTLFADVRALERACVHEATAAGWSSQPFWRYELQSPGECDEQALSDRLFTLIQESVTRQARRHPIVVSLSGGHDSCTILGILAEYGRPAGLSSVSYSHGEPPPDSDPDVARKIAGLFGVPHQTVESYDGRFWPTLDANVRSAMGYAGFCNEPNIRNHIGAMAREGRCGSLFVGEECWGMPGSKLRSPADALSPLRIYPMTVLRPLFPCIPGRQLEAMRRALRRHHDEIYHRADHLADWQDKKMWFHLDQRLPYRLLPGRELNLGSMVVVCNPLLDNSILDFMMRVPRAMRLDKALFVRTMERRLPEAFRLPRARFAGTHPDWAALFLGHERELNERTRAQASRLDDLIPPAAVALLLEDLKTRSSSRRTEGWGGPLRAGIRVMAGLHPAADRMARPLLDRLAQPLDTTIILKRLLTLRLWLTGEHCRATPLRPAE